MLTSVSAGITSFGIGGGVPQATVRKRGVLPHSVRPLCSFSCSTHLILCSLTSRKKRKLSHQGGVGRQQIDEYVAVVVLLDELQESVSELVKNTYGSIQRVRDKYTVA